MEPCVRRLRIGNLLLAPSLVVGSLFAACVHVPAATSPLSLAAASSVGDGGALTVGVDGSHHAFVVRADGTTTALGGSFVAPPSTFSTGGVDYYLGVRGDHHVYVRTAARPWAPLID